MDPYEGDDLYVTALECEIEAAHSACMGHGDHTMPLAKRIGIISRRVAEEATRASKLMEYIDEAKIEADAMGRVSGEPLFRFLARLRSERELGYKP